MSKVLRLHQQGNDNIKSWEKANRYGSDVINQIIDPEGMSSNKEITSIPSPFARVDLVKTAFAEVNKSGNLEGDSIYHKLVSDALDVGEIFFNFDKLQDKLEIIIWDKEDCLNKMEASSEEEHRILGRTLRLFLEQDADAYNFDKCDRFYLLNYKGPGRPDEMNIIGATSPATLFICSANDLSYASRHLRFSGPDKPFDDKYTPLSERDFRYQKYLHALKNTNPDFAVLFPEFYQYLNECYSKLGDRQKQDIDGLKETMEANGYKPLGYGGNTVEILGMKLYTEGDAGEDTLPSDFTIKSAICEDGRLPLVLPVNKGNDYDNYLYVQANWEKDNHAPYLDRKEVSERTLPQTAQRYPYLTISDFLTEYIVSMPFEMTDSYFDGNVSERKKGFSYLLPLTELFFKYFTVEDLQGTVGNGRKMIEMMPLAGGSVAVTLRIPVAKGCVEYSRTYYAASSPELENNKGAVEERKFGLGVMPLIDFHNNVNSAHYRVAFMSRDNSAALGFHDVNGRTVAVQADIVRRRPDPGLCGVRSYVLKSSFNRISYEDGQISNVIIPKFKTAGNADVFTFAVDFGTTNTHIEYKVADSNVIHAFDMKNEESQMQRLHKKDDINKEDIDINAGFMDAFIPEAIGESQMYSFPIRTVLAARMDMDINQSNYSLADANIPFRYEKACTPPYNKLKTDIKWSGRADNTYVELYLDNLFFLMRNKVLLNDGNLSATRIVWFYPASMTEGQKTRFREIWKAKYRAYFGEHEDNLVELTESVAPYFYYKKRKGAMSNVVTIDIGGGTTDIYVTEKDKPKILSSFRFAANTIFGDGYNFSPAENGFVKTFEPQIRTVLTNISDKVIGKSDLTSTFDNILRREVSTDVIAFFFSLDSNKTIADNEIPVDFNKKLAADEKLKYAFIVFYGAILYYVASMMKAKGLDLPQNIAFSGNGSKTINVLSTDSSVIDRFARMIFEKVYGRKYEDSSLHVILDKEPKLATCKGGIDYAPSSESESPDIDGIRADLLGIDDITFTENLTYNDLDDAKIRAVAASVKKFIEFLFELDNENNGFFMRSLSADASIRDKVIKICCSDLEEYARQGLKRRLEDMKAEGGDLSSRVEETMFFYPIVPMLNRLASKISGII